MSRDTFASFQPAQWQEEGLVTALPVSDQGKGSAQKVVRRMEKWVAATSMAVALSTAFVAIPTSTSFIATSASGVSKRIILGTEKSANKTVAGAEVPANYWSDLAKEVSSWPRLSTNANYEDDGPEPIA
jgi:hypothetical protein